jgi:hypothetical protein
MNQPAPFIWTDAHGKGRNRYALFRRSFNLDAALEATPPNLFHLFADTRYRLIVNGVTLGHGPARFFTISPEFDSFDLTPHLRPGRNVIAVIVNSFDAIAFSADRNAGGLCAWGELQDATGKRIDLNTGNGAWKAIDSPGHDPVTHHLSFASGPAEFFDARQMPADWDQPGFDDSAWSPAAIRQDARWGPLQPRSIPQLDESIQRPTRRLGVWSAMPQAGETIHSLFVVSPGGKSLETQARVAVLAYLFSATDRDVRIGAWWGKFWLNGIELLGQKRHDLEVRQDFPCHLRAGWNTLLVHDKMGGDFFDFTIGLPAGVEISAQKTIGSPNTFLIGGPWEGELLEKADALGWPLESQQALPPELGPWKKWPRDRRSQYPMKQRGWRTFRPLPNNSEEHKSAGQLASELPLGTALSLLYEFDGEAIGRPLLEITAAAGTTVDLFYTERRKPDGTADVNSEPWGLYFGERYITRAGRQRIHTFHPRGMKYLEVLVSGDLIGFELHDLAITRANYPVTFVGDFECSDPMLQKIWQMGRDTQFACMEDAYLDCPWRERGLYAGDMLVQFPVSLACFGDTKLMRRCLELFLLSQDQSGLIAGGAFGLPAGRHPDYSAILLIAAREYWAGTGDVRALKAFLPRIKRLAHGLASLKSADPILLDGSHLHPYLDNCFIDKGGINCTLNCFYQRAFHNAALIFELTGETSLATEFTQRAAALAGAIRENFWDESRGLFTDRRKSDKPDTQPSVPANTLPLLWGIALESQTNRVLPWLMQAMEKNHRVDNPRRNDDFNVNAYFSFYCLGVLYQFGKTVEAEAFIRREWGRMIDAGAWTCWEYFADTNSRCHAWAAAPTHYLSAEVLGVRFPEPGNINRIQISPVPGTLSWARGVYPHPAGPIRVSWTRDGDGMRVQHEAPQGVTVAASPKDPK